MTPPHLGRSSRVLVARLDSLGDVLLAGPAVRAVARRAAVTMLVRSGLAETAELLPGVDDVVEFDAAWVLLDPPRIHDRAIADLLEAVEARHFDAALVLTSFHQSPLPLALLLRMAHVPSVRTIRAPSSICAITWLMGCRSRSATSRLLALPGSTRTRWEPGWPYGNRCPPSLVGSEPSRTWSSIPVRQCPPGVRPPRTVGQLWRRCGRPDIE
jgi:hypothetical protein